MRLFPSIPAAIVCGAVIMPLSVEGNACLEEAGWHPVIRIAWLVIAFFAPVLFSTLDFSYFRGRGLLAFFRPAVSAAAFRTIYLPAWGRMLVLFLSTIVSIGTLSHFGIKPGQPIHL
jgi:hypothetical protein